MVKTKMWERVKMLIIYYYYLYAIFLGPKAPPFPHKVVYILVEEAKYNQNIPIKWDKYNIAILRWVHYHYLKPKKEIGWIGQLSI